MSNNEILHRIINPKLYGEVFRPRLKRLKCSAYIIKCVCIYNFIFHYILPLITNIVSNRLKNVGKKNQKKGQIFVSSISDYVKCNPDCMFICCCCCNKSFFLLKSILLNRKPNIFDNMIAMLEKYSYNLESLVQERTIQLLEEKKKTENLLLRMLPK